jgi:hypothetical protein
VPTAEITQQRKRNYRNIIVDVSAGVYEKTVVGNYKIHIVI